MHFNSGLAQNHLWESFIFFLLVAKPEFSKVAYTGPQRDDNRRPQKKHTDRMEIDTGIFVVEEQTENGNSLENHLLLT